ncbi:MAG: spore coat protein U domain-containing protein [Thermodesulfobacteriota bacterium]
MKRLILGSVAFVMAMGLAVASYGATTATTSVGMSVNVVPQCSVSPTNITFGSYDGTINVGGQGSIQVKCPAGTVVDILLNGGMNQLSAAGHRMMGNTSGAGQNNIPVLGTGAIEYTITKPGGSGDDWGDNGASHGGTAHQITVGSSGVSNVPINATLLANPGFRGAGQFYDGVSVTISY